MIHYQLKKFSLFISCNPIQFCQNDRKLITFYIKKLFQLDNSNIGAVMLGLYQQKCFRNHQIMQLKALRNKAYFMVYWNFLKVLQQLQDQLHFQWIKKWIQGMNEINCLIFFLWFILCKILSIQFIGINDFYMTDLQDNNTIFESFSDTSNQGHKAPVFCRQQVPLLEYFLLIKERQQQIFVPKL